MSASQVVLFAVELFRSPVIGLLVLFAMESRYSLPWNRGTLWCGISTIKPILNSTNDQCNTFERCYHYDKEHKGIYTDHEIVSPSHKSTHRESWLLNYGMILP